eukprot:3339090-Rhodomonas_salina.1
MRQTRRVFWGKEGANLARARAVLRLQPLLRPAPSLSLSLSSSLSVSPAQSRDFTPSVKLCQAVSFPLHIITGPEVETVFDPRKALFPVPGYHRMEGCEAT